MKRARVMWVLMMMLMLMGCGEEGGGAGGGGDEASVEFVFDALGRFEPDEHTVTKGAVVRWVNNTGTSRALAVPELGVSEELGAGASFDLVAEEVGTFFFHDPTDQAFNGALVVID